VDTSLELLFRVLAFLHKEALLFNRVALCAREEALVVIVRGQGNVQAMRPDVQELRVQVFLHVVQLLLFELHD